MAYNARTWASGEVVTASSMNTLRDALEYLKGNAGALTIGAALTVSGVVTATSFSGAVPDASLSSNVPRLNAANVFTAAQTINGTFVVASTSTTVSALDASGPAVAGGAIPFVMTAISSSTGDIVVSIAHNAARDGYLHILFDSGGNAQFSSYSGGKRIDLNPAGGGVKVAASSGSIGFYGTTPASKPTVSGSRGSNAALASLCTALASLGLITNSTT